jgi:hypothetical protein
VKQTAVVISFLALGLFQPEALAWVELGGLNGEDHPFDAGPLMQWDEPDIFAEQLPVAQPATPPLVQAPVAPATAAPVQPAPEATPVPNPPVLDTTPPAPGDKPEVTDPAGPAVDGAAEEDFSLGDIPIIETIELTTDKAKKALDTYVLVRDKYKDAQLENYENLQDFVDQSAQGKAFDADVKAAGFPNVIEWNTTITTLSFAYDNSVNDQTLIVKQQIEELKADTETAADMRERMIKALQSMIPSDNNKKVLEEIKSDPAYTEKLKMLETETE